MTAFLIFALGLTGLSLAAWRWGTDTRCSSEWRWASGSNEQRAC